MSSAGAAEPALTGRIVVGVDGSPSSEQALWWAVGRQPVTAHARRPVVGHASTSGGPAALHEAGG